LALLLSRESAVSARIIGAPMVIVVWPLRPSRASLYRNQYDSAAVLRLHLLILGASFGGFGITMGLLGALVHMSALESFGFAYLSPAVPFDVEDSKDALCGHLSG
jgi:spore germination protein KA